MNTSIWLVCILVLSSIPAFAQALEFSVRHDHLIGSCQGKLIFTDNRIEYRTEHKKHGQSWAFLDIQQLAINGRTQLEILTYQDEWKRAGLDRAWKFILLEGEITPEISARLLAQIKRPLITSVMPPTTDAPRFTAAVKHLHMTGGCTGGLKIYADRITFESEDRPEHSRYWRYADLESFAQPSRARFVLTAFEGGGEGGGGGGGERNFNFQLKEALPAAAYDYIWTRIYPTKFRRPEERSQSANIVKPPTT